MWRKVLPELSRTHRCIAPDLRGLGWSDAPPYGYEKTQLAEDMLALLDALGIDRLPVIGHDWGALTAVLMSHMAPERVERCLALSIPAPWDANLDPRRLLPFAYGPVLSAPFAERLVPQVTAQLLKLSGFSAEDAEPYLRVLRQPERRRATVQYYRTFLTRELPRFAAHPIGRPDVPIRVLGGTGDPICRWSPSVEKVAGARHFLPEDRPDAVIETAREFL
jgi:pimeloyl-ACP methyl ester carboxylesterase